MDSRLRTVEERIGDLREEMARLAEAERNNAESRDQLCQAVGELRRVVQDLRDDVNKGRGIIWAVAGGSGGIVGALILWLIDKFGS